MRNEMKARGTLLMALLNKDELKFHSYKEAKLLMEAIEKRSSSETMDQTFDKLQKLISQLEIQGETISQEDMNLKLLRSLPSEWKTHALIWRNKVEIETISLDDLYNNLKIYELELKDSTNTSQNSPNVAFVSSNSTNSNSSTNEADNTAYGVGIRCTGGMIGATKLKKSILQTLALMAHTSSGSYSSLDSENSTARDKAVGSKTKEKRDNAVKASDAGFGEAKNILHQIHSRNILTIDAQAVQCNESSINEMDIKREFSVARTPQQNGVAKRRNRTLIEAARTMKPLLIYFMKPFGCPVTILNTRDHLGKFDEKANEGFFVGYSVVSKAMRVFNKRTGIVKETLNIRFLENIPNVTGNGPDWLFDVDSLTISMNYVPVKIKPEQEYILIPICTTDLLISQDPRVSEEDAKEKPTEMDKSGALDKDGEDDQATRSDTPVSTAGPSCINDDPSSPVNAAEASNAFEEHLFKRFSPFKNAFTLPPVSNVTPMDDTGIFGNAYDDEDVGAEADLNNLETTMNVSPIPTTRIDKDHPKDQIIRDFNSAIQTRRMTKISDEHAMVCYINKQRRKNHKDYQNCLFSCFLSQMEPKKVIQALEDPSWIEAM
ncbi:putative ribonuclease H-like domain-containing protein [Tanacetum coccineum]